MREDGRRTGYILGKTPGAERILLFDDFESLLKWSVIAGVHRPRVTKDTSVAFNGNACARFFSGSITPNGVLESVAYRDLYVVGAGHGRYRVELVFRNLGMPWSFGFGFLKWVDGVERALAVRHASAYFEWEYLGADGAYYFLAGSGSNYAVGGWHRIAFEFEWDPSEYVLLEVDGDIFGMTGVEYYQYASALPTLGQGVRLSMQIAGAGHSMYVDDVLVRCK